MGGEDDPKIPAIKLLFLAESEAVDYIAFLPGVTLSIPHPRV